MKTRFAAAVLTTLCATAACAQTNVGVSIGIRQPGVYGRIELGNFPPPPVVYAQPVLIAPPAVVVQQEPLYLYVPVVQQRQWGRHCARYAACGRPVYFVQERWVVERYDEDRGRGRGKHKKSKHDKHDKHGDD
jgi:hypothetical protein